MQRGAASDSGRAAARLAACSVVGRLLADRLTAAQTRAERPGRSAAGFAAAAALCVTLASCSSGDPAPNYSTVSRRPSSTASQSSGPSGSGSPSVSPSPTIPTTGPNVQPGDKPPAETAEAKENSSVGALAFVGYYVKTLDWVYATSDPDILSPFFDPQCATCKDSLNFLNGLVENDSHFVGGRLTIRRVAIVSNDGRAGATFAVSSEVDAEPAQVITATGAIATQFQQASAATLTDWLRWTGTNWAIVEERYA